MLASETGAKMMRKLIAISCSDGWGHVSNIFVTLMVSE